MSGREANLLLGHTTTTAYDADGNVTSVIDPLGHGEERIEYDGLNRQTKVIDPLGGVTTTAYDADGNVTSVTDSVGNITSKSYDADNRLDESMTTTRSYGYSYDAAAGSSSTIRTRRTRTFAYDAADHLTTKTWYDDSHHVVNTQAFTYDASDNRLTASDFNGSYTYTYDASDRGNDRAGAVRPDSTRMTPPAITPSAGGTTTYQYDAANPDKSPTTTVETPGPMIGTLDLSGSIWLCLRSKSPIYAIFRLLSLLVLALPPSIRR